MFLRMRKIVLRASLAIGAAALATAGLADCKSDETSTPSEPVRIGSLSSLTGNLAGLGGDFARATNLAVEEINQGGGVLDRSLSLLEADDATTTEGARTAFSGLVQKKVPIILGPTTSAQVLELAPVIRASKVVTIGRTTTAPALTTVDDGDFFFRITPSDEKQGPVLAGIIAESGVSGLCVIARADTYGKSLADAVKTALPATMKVVESTYTPDQQDLSGVFAPCESMRCGSGDGGVTPGCFNDDKVGVLLVTFVADGVAVVNAGISRGWSAKKQKYFASDGFRDPSVFSLLTDPSALDGLQGTSPSGPDPSTAAGDGLRTFRERYLKRFGAQANVFTENAYDAAYIAAIAIERAKGLDATVIRDHLRDLSPDGEVVSPGDWKTAREKVRTAAKIKYAGASGVVVFDARGDRNPPYAFSNYGVAEGKLVDRKTIVVQ
jgi:branched-chain amino acid transport system substrate-binding protein